MFRNNSGLTFEDISDEMYRIYEFADKEIRIDAPLRLHRNSHGHRIFTADGESQYIPTGWRRLRWRVHPNQPNFAF